MSNDSFDIAFHAPLTHRLRFTRDAMGRDQQVLVDLLEASGDEPARVQFWLDQQLAEAQPDLPARMRAIVDQQPHLRRVGNVQIVPGGEEIKNDIHILERMLKVFHAADLDRRSYVVVVGGGAVLDAVGFAVAIAHRGLRLVRLPSTTLAQGDSGVGVKNGVNLFQKKNWLGSFATPWGVINDQGLLATLSDRDFRGGFSEAVKVALLKDASLFDSVCRSASAIAARDMEVAHSVLRQSALLHIRHITQGGDPFEIREARPLDFGHWSAHRLESMSDFQLRHGEAVAIGVAIDAVYSVLAHGLQEEVARRAMQCMTDLGFTLHHPLLGQAKRLRQGLEEFRQHLGGRLTVTMLKEVEQPIDVHQVDWPLMEQAIATVNQWVGGQNPAQPGRQPL